MQSGVNVSDEKFKDNVLKALADEYSRAIFTSIMDKAKSVIEISMECRWNYFWCRAVGS